AATDTLFDPLRVPGKVVVDDLRAELKVYAFGGRLRRDHDRGMVAEFLDQRSAHIDGARPGNLLGALGVNEPALVDILCPAVRIGTTESHNLIGVTVTFKKVAEVVLGSP